jgi:NAD-dependent SIR2 family protein deacetylase
MSSVSAARSGGGLDLETTASLIALPDAKVVVMLGAGVSVSAGIPDFRTPGSGLYDNLQEYGLPAGYPEAVFDLDFFSSNPKPFQRLCKELWPGTYAPTPTHAFLKVMHAQGKLLRCFTQNIDSLETAAGLPADAVVAAHGNFDSAHVVGTDAPVPVEEVKAAAFGGEPAWRALEGKYGGRVKPSIVFFGENLPHRFFERAAADVPSASLLLVMGTSLAVQPFASLVGHTARGTPRLLVNRERVGEGPFGCFDFSSPTDGYVLGDSDSTVRELCTMLGWEEALRDAIESARKKKI